MGIEQTIVKFKNWNSKLQQVKNTQWQNNTSEWIRRKI